MYDLKILFIVCLLALALVLGLQCVQLIDQRNEAVMVHYAPMMEATK
jgi:hypothetical protein